MKNKDTNLIGLIWLIGITMAVINFLNPVHADDIQFGSQLSEVQTEYADLYLLQKSIAICEGGLNEKSLAWKNRNAGNIKAGGHTDRQGHTIFGSRLEGYLAHLELLQRRYWKLTPKQMNVRYATDKNWHKCVSWYYNPPKI